PARRLGAGRLPRGARRPLPRRDGRRDPDRGDRARRAQEDHGVLGGSGRACELARSGNARPDGRRDQPPAAPDRVRPGRRRRPRMPRKHPVITIDGPAGAGKSTVARVLAERLGYTLIPTGAMYRALALSMMRSGVPAREGAELSAHLAPLSIVVAAGHVYLN